MDKMVGMSILTGVSILFNIAQALVSRRINKVDSKDEKLDSTIVHLKDSVADVRIDDARDSVKIRSLDRRVTVIENDLIDIKKDIKKVERIDVELKNLNKSIESILNRIWSSSDMARFKNEIIETTNKDIKIANNDLLVKISEMITTKLGGK